MLVSQTQPMAIALADEETQPMADEETQPEVLSVHEVPALDGYWNRRNVPPLKNKEVFDYEAEGETLVTWWTVEKCPIKSCKNWCRAKCCSMVSETHCVAYAKNHFMTHAVQHNQRSWSEANDLCSELPVQKTTYKMKELAFWLSPDGPKPAKRQRVEDEGGAANRGRSSSSHHELPRPELKEVVEFLQLAERAISTATKCILVACESLQTEAEKIQQTVHRLKRDHPRGPFDAD